MQQQKRGFTLMEILIAMSVLIVGLFGIVALFPVGLDAARKAIEDTNAAMIAESVYSSLRAAVQRSAPDGNIVFFYDGINPASNKYPTASGYVLKKSQLLNKTFGIPNFHKQDNTSSNGQPIDIYTTVGANTVSNYRVNPPNQQTGAANDCCKLGTNGGMLYDLAVIGDNPLKLFPKDSGQLAQYSFNVQIAYPDTNPKNLYDIIIRVYRNDRLIKKFYTQMMIPTSDN